MITEKQITLIEVDREELKNNKKLERTEILCVDPITKLVTIGYINPKEGMTVDRMLQYYDDSTKFYIL